VAEGGSQGLVTLTCLQDLSQARTRWGTAADGFLTLHAAKIALGGIADPSTLKALSYLAGTVDLAYHARSGGLFLAAPYENGWSQSIQQRPRIPPETINTLPAGCAYLAHTTWPPRIVTLHPPRPPRPRRRRRPVYEELQRAVQEFARTLKRRENP
jgi:hypothetical protein